MPGAPNTIKHNKAIDFTFYHYRSVTFFLVVGWLFVFYPSPPPS
jgi:hypothetical protein